MEGYGVGNDQDNLIGQLREGNTDAFKTIYDEYGGKMYSTAFRMLGNESDAADVVQEVFLTISRKIGMFKGKSSLSTWIFRITVNASLDRRRKMNATASLSIDQLLDAYGEAPLGTDRAEDRPSAAAESAELRQDVSRAIAALRPKLAAVVTLRYDQGLGYEEIAGALDCSIGTVKSRLARAHKKLIPLLERIHKRHFEMLESTDEL